MFKMIYLPTAEEIELPDWLKNTKEAFLEYLNDPNTRICKYTYNSYAASMVLVIRKQSFTKIKTICMNPNQYLSFGEELEKYHIDIIEV